MVKWLDLELQLAMLQILLDAEQRQLERPDEIDLSNVHENRREQTRQYYFELSANSGFVTQKQIESILQLEEGLLVETIQFLKTNSLILVSIQGFKITPAGTQFIIDELNKVRD